MTTKIQKIEKRIKHKKNELLLDIRPIMDDLADEFDNKIPYLKFVEVFNSRTNTEFEKRHNGLKKYLKNWELSQVFQDVPHETLRYDLYENDNKDKFIVIQNLPEGMKRVGTVLPKKKRRRATVMPQGGCFPVDAEDKRNSWEILNGKTVVFTVPCWPGVSAEFRANNQNLYEEFLNISSPKKKVSESIYLAEKWWSSEIQKLPQILYIVSKLEIFKLTSLDQSIAEVFPSEWAGHSKNFGINYGVFGISKSKLVELNLIVRCDAENANMFTKNEIIRSCKFEPINNEITSLLYDFAENYRSCSIERANKMLLDNMTSWRNRDPRDRTLEIRQVLRNNDDIFDYAQNGDEYSAAKYKDIIFVPLYFSSSYR